MKYHSVLKVPYTVATAQKFDEKTLTNGALTKQ